MKLNDMCFNITGQVRSGNWQSWTYETQLMVRQLELRFL